MFLCFHSLVLLFVTPTGICLSCSFDKTFCPASKFLFFRQKQLRHFPAVFTPINMIHTDLGLFTTRGNIFPSSLKYFVVSCHFSHFYVNKYICSELIAPRLFMRFDCSCAFIHMFVSDRLNITTIVAKCFSLYFIHVH